MVFSAKLSPDPSKLPSVEPNVEQIESGSSLWKDARHRMRQNRLAWFSMWVLLGMFLFCFVGPFVVGHTYNIPDFNRVFAPPGGGNWFGTDDLGRDQLVRIMVGGRVSLGVGILATVVSLLIGVTYGAVAAYLGGKTDRVMMRFVDVLYALPFTIFVILLMTLFERSMFLLFIAIGAVEWLTMARLVRGQVMSLKKQEFIEAAVSLGLSRSRIIFRHIVPNILGVVVVYATLTVPSVILLESFLSFLGLGVQPPMPSWGSLIKLGADNIQLYPYLLIIPALFFSLTLFCLNFLGDGLRDALDPKTRND